ATQHRMNVEIKHPRNKERKEQAAIALECVQGGTRIGLPKPNQKFSDKGNKSYRRGQPHMRSEGEKFIVHQIVAISRAQQRITLDLFQRRLVKVKPFEVTCIHAETG